MDQLKDILNQAIKYRFWIAVGLAAVIPMIGFFVAHGSITDETGKKSAEITGAQKGLEAFSGEVKNKQYITAVQERTEVLTKNVDESWRTLYERQAPLLDWPESVVDYFPKWGRARPADVDPNEFSQATAIYMRDYRDYVDKVYATIRPFNYEDGTGVVVCPPEDALLAPSTFTITKPPSLGGVWDAQEKLWLQRTVLDVLNQVNKGAKDWDGAKVKQLVTMTVGNSAAQDQRSRVANQELMKSPEIEGEGGESGGGGGGGGGSTPGPMGSDGEMSAMMSASYGPSGGTGGGSAPDAKAAIMYIVTESTQYRLFPIHVKVLVDQNYIPELLSAFQNSPMTIDVREIRIQRPEQRVVKPKKGQQNPFGGMMMGGYGGFEGEGMGGYSMFGGRGAMGAMGAMGGYGGYAGGGDMEGGRGPMSGAYGGAYGGMAGGNTPKKTGVSVRDQLKKKAADKKDQDKDADEPKFEIYDPYYNLVMIDIYGQARIYTAPPAPEAVETVAASEPTEPAAEGATPAEGMNEGEATEAPKPGDEPETKPEAPAGDEPKGDEPKAETPKTEPGDAPKGKDGEPAKSDTPPAKGDEPEPKR